MRIRQLIIAAVLAATALGAQATVYTYTGNFDYIYGPQSDPGPFRMTAWFDIAFDGASPAQPGAYHIDGWAVNDGWFTYTAELGASLYTVFSFDAAGKMTDWYFDTNVLGDHGDWESFYQWWAHSSSGGRLPNGTVQPAMDFAGYDTYRGTLVTMLVENDPGTWTVESTTVPEPDTLGLLGMGAAAGAVAYAGARKRAVRRPGRRAARAAAR